MIWDKPGSNPSLLGHERVEVQSTRAWCCGGVMTRIQALLYCYGREDGDDDDDPYSHPGLLGASFERIGKSGLMAASFSTSKRKSAE